MTAVGARFDDLGPAGTSFVLADPSEVLKADRPGDVAGVIRAAEEAARRGQWVAGFVTYEAASGLDPALPALDWPAGHPLAALPLAWFAAFRRREELAPCVPATSGQPPAAGGRAADLAFDRDCDWHRRALATIQEEIAAGEYYQLNLTARLSGTIADPVGFYATLATSQAGRYNALIATGEHTIVSASPELFFSRNGDLVVTRPMKGTAARGRWPAEDRARQQELRDSDKERAENVMIVDLLRNDLGRVARTGSVHVPTLFATERYPTVWQLTSTVTASLEPATGLDELFAALFPSGSVTGAPKRAAMQAIARLEGRPRGVYCGAVGYLEPHPSRPAARFSVAIRTVTTASATGYAEYGTGGAITSGSRPAAEWAELLTKAAVLRGPARPERLIETLRFEPPARLVNLNGHLARLRASADYFDFPYDPAAVDAALAAAAADRRRPARVRLSLWPSGLVQAEAEDLKPVPAVVSVGLAGSPVRSDDLLLFHKHGDRASYDRFRQARPDLDDVVLWNEREEVTETTIANIAVHIDGRWWTPPLACGLLPGVERGRLVDTGTLAERVITVDELADAGGLAVVSSLRGWRPAKLRD